MRLLLDTHTLLWSLIKNSPLSQSTRDAIESADNVLVSSVSIWEICNKYHVGKLEHVSPIIHRLEEIIAEKNYSGLPISLAHAARAALLPNHHRDPWDRLLIAQALIENLTIVSNETLFDQYAVQRLW